MNLRLLLIPTFAMLALAVPALAQYRSSPPTQQSVPQPQTAPATPPSVTAPTAAPAAPAAPTITAADVLPQVPPHHCVAPEYPGSNATNAKMTAFNSDYKNYSECIKKYVDGNKAWMDAVREVSNKAVEEYNQYSLNLKKQIDAAKE